MFIYLDMRDFNYIYLYIHLYIVPVHIFTVIIWLSFLSTTSLYLMIDKERQKHFHCNNLIEFIPDDTFASLNTTYDFWTRYLLYNINDHYYGNNKHYKFDLDVNRFKALWLLEHLSSPQIYDFWLPFGIFKLSSY